MSNPGRNSVVQCLAARPIHVAAAAGHIMETYSSEQDYTPVGKTVFSFFKWAYMHYSLVCFPAGLFGYSEVTMIPAGATHIRVTDNSANYLG